MQEAFRKEIETTLRESRAEWEKRLQAIQADRRRRGGALEQDFEEQAVQRENDDTLDALDTRGRQELREIDAALDRLSKGSFGRCGKCGKTISNDRLRAEPTAETCVACATRA